MGSGLTTSLEDLRRGWGQSSSRDGSGVSWCGAPRRLGRNGAASPSFVCFGASRQRCPCVDGAVQPATRGRDHRGGGHQRHGLCVSYAQTVAHLRGEGGGWVGESRGVERACGQGMRGVWAEGGQRNQCHRPCVCHRRWCTRRGGCGLEGWAGAHLRGCGAGVNRMGAGVNRTGAGVNRTGEGVRKVRRWGEGV